MSNSFMESVSTQLGRCARCGEVLGNCIHTISGDYGVMTDEEAKEILMRSNNPPAIEVIRGESCPINLSILALGHRSLEKGAPKVENPNDGQVHSFSVPVDLLSVAGYPDDLVAGIEEVTLEYQKR